MFDVATVIWIWASLSSAIVFIMYAVKTNGHVTGTEILLVVLISLLLGPFVLVIMFFLWLFSIFAESKIGTKKFFKKDTTSE